MCIRDRIERAFSILSIARNKCISTIANAKTGENKVLPNLERERNADIIIPRKLPEVNGESEGQFLLKQVN